jgi:type I restriction enzyme, S subunit
VTVAEPTSSPEGWQPVRLGDVADQRLGKMLDAKKNKGQLLPYLRNPNVRWFDVDTSDLRTMRFEDRELDRYGLRSGDVLICEGGEAGRAAIWDARASDVKFQKAIHRVRPGSRLFNRFLVHQLSVDYHSGRLADYYTGATIKHLTGQDLLRYKIALPSFPEQCRIVEVLDRADALRAKRRTVLARLDTLTQSIFLDTFGDPATNPKGWPCLPLGHVVETVQIGPFGSLMHQSDYVDGGTPVVNPMHIVDGQIVVSAAHAVRPEKALALARYRLRQGDIVIGRRGEMGRCAVVQGAQEGMICGSGSAVIRPDLRQVRPVYLQAVLSHSATKKVLERNALGITMLNLNSAIIAATPVLVPPIKFQMAYERTVQVLDANIETSLAGLQALDNLFASLQHRAFRGEL